MRKIHWMMLSIILLVGVSVVGCAKKAPTGGASTPTAKLATEKTPAAAAPAEYTFEALCNKLIKETKAVTPMFSGAIEQKTKDGCIATSKGYESMPDSNKMMAAYAKTILEPCKDKSGKDWLACYVKQTPEAGKAAMAVMNVKK